MSERKNIFLIGRRRMVGDEDQLTEMLAFLWQEAPETLERWLYAIGLATDLGRVMVETQFTIPSGKRPDIAIFSPGACSLVESKLGSGFSDTQVGDYLEYLSTVPGRKALVLLTQLPESIPPHYVDQAKELGVRLVSQRWHDMSQHVGEPGEESLAGDFIQLLIREGLVKPEPLTMQDWTTWNGGYNVLLRLDAVLGELDPFVRRMRPAADWRATSGLTKRWIYRVWRAEGVELGFGFGAAPNDKEPHGDPVAFAFVGNTSATEADAMRAVGVEKGTRYQWSDNEKLKAGCGLTYSWPSLSRWCRDVLTSDASFEQQVEEAATFLHDTAQYFRSRGYLPLGLELSAPVGVRA